LGSVNKEKNTTKLINHGYYIQLMKRISKRISKNSTVTGTIADINTIANAMSEDEYRKAREFYRFLVSITKCDHGVLSIDRERLIKVASAYMDCDPLEAYNILRKMMDYGWILIWDRDFIIVNLEEKT